MKTIQYIKQKLAECEKISSIDNNRCDDYLLAQIATYRDILKYYRRDSAGE